MTWTRRVRTATLPLSMIAYTAACGGGDGGPGPSPVPAAVEVTPGTSTLQAFGAALQFTAVARDARGNVMSGVSFTWTNSSPTVATVTGSGLVTAVGDGTTDITATAGGVSGTATVTVAQSVASVTVTPGSVTTTDATQQFNATARDASGNVVPGATFAWSTDNPSVATVNGSGRAAAVNGGTTMIKALASKGIAGTATWTVILTFDVVSAGDHHACGLRTGGRAYCWGLNADGQLGDGTTTRRLTPVAVAGGHVWTAIKASGRHTCALTPGGTVYCWGQNTRGQLGTGTTFASPTPVLVVGGQLFSFLTAGWEHTCGVTSGIGRVVYCWGSNARGQLGMAAGPCGWCP